jgi:hypothetical protein
MFALNRVPDDHGAAQIRMSRDRNQPKGAVGIAISSRFPFTKVL